MKKILLFAIALAAICLMPSCKKDPVTNTITFGDTRDMDVVEYNSTFFRYYTHHGDLDPTIEINYLRCDTILDFNNDGYEDILFSSSQGEFWPFHDVLNDEYFSIRRVSHSVILGNSSCRFYCDQVACDIYRHSDTTILHNNDTTIFVVEHFNNYKPITAFDPFQHTYKTNIIHLCNAGDQLSKDAFFEEHPRPLYTYPFEVYGEEYHSNDTIYYQATYNIDNPSFNCPLDEEKYVGFVIREEDGTRRLGWLKILLVSQPDGTHRMRLLETAIQKQQIIES